MSKSKKQVSDKEPHRHYNISHLFERISRSVEALVDGQGDLRSRLFTAWNSISPLCVDKWPPALEPVFQKIVSELAANDRTQEQQAETARCLLRLYQHMIEMRIDGHQGRMLRVDQILERSVPAMLSMRLSGAR